MAVSLGQPNSCAQLVAGRDYDSSLDEPAQKPMKEMREEPIAWLFFLLVGG